MPRSSNTLVNWAVGVEARASVGTAKVGVKSDGDATAGVRVTLVALGEVDGSFTTAAQYESQLDKSIGHWHVEILNNTKYGIGS